MMDSVLTKLYTLEGYDKNCVLYYSNKCKYINEKDALNQFLKCKKRIKIYDEYDIKSSFCTLTLPYIRQLELKGYHVRTLDTTHIKNTCVMWS